MTENEAIKELKAQIETAESMISYNMDFEPKHDNSILENKIKAAKMGISALEKQIPKKPILDTIYHQQYHCPNCEDELCKKYEYDKRDTYCQWCGQAIDWEK